MDDAAGAASRRHSLQSGDQIAEEQDRSRTRWNRRGDKMSRMFCTLKEAAKTLNANEDQIQTLLARGILHEFREGPHRFVKESDVGALALKCRQRAAGSRTSQPQAQTQRPSPAPGEKPKAKRPAAANLRHSATAVAPAPARHRTRSKRRKTEDGRRRAQDRPLRTAPSPVTRTPRPVLQEPAPIVQSRSPECLSVRQWFWTGLVQDRPIAIALLSGLVLLLLSGLVAGLCLVAEIV
jgi:hypothetical protein